MSELTARFKMIDGISSKLNNIAESGQRLLGVFDETGSYADSFDDLGTSISRNSNMFNSLNNSLENYNENLGDATESLNDLVEIGESGTNSFGRQSTLIGDATENIREYGEQSEEASRQSEEFGEQSTESVESLADVFVSTGIVVAVNELAGSFMECSEAAGVFEVATAKVASIADTTKMSIGDISGSIEELSNETGISVSSLSEATYQAISASVDTANAVDFVGTSNKLAAGGFTETATAVDVLTTALNAYNLDGSEATKISDMLITTQNLGKTSVDELAQSVGKVIPIAAAYNVEMDNLSSAYAVLTAGGIATAETGTYLKAMLNELGDSGSAVAAVLQEETGKSFAELTVIQQVY